MDQTPTTTPGAPATRAHTAEPHPDGAAATEQPAVAAADGPSAEAPAGGAEGDGHPQGFGTRGRMRRRARFLRKARELAYRDLGGLVFNLHRFGQRNDDLVLAKLNLLAQMDHELRALEDALAERQPITVLREAGVTACPRCAAIHASEDRYCPRCGLSLGRHPALPIAVAGGTAPPGAEAGRTGSAPAASHPPAASAEPAAPAPAVATESPPPARGPASPAAGADPVAAPTTPAVHASPPAAAKERVTEIIRPPAHGQ